MATKTVDLTWVGNGDIGTIKSDLEEWFLKTRECVLCGSVIRQATCVMVVSGYRMVGTAPNLQGARPYHATAKYEEAT